MPLFSLKPVPSPHLVGLSRGAPLSVARGRWEEDSQVRREFPVLIPDAMDSHMHLDRSFRRLRLDHSTGIRNPPLSRRSTWWGMFVYCDPKSWPKDPERLHLPEGWVIAVGVHPKHAMDFGDYYFDRLTKLFDSPAVTALGGVGIDCSEGAKPFGIHQSTLKWVLSLACPYMPLVFHIQASGVAPRQRIRYTGRYWA